MSYENFLDSWNPEFEKLGMQLISNYKKWFNKNFSLSLNGKWSGLDRVSNLDLFKHKLNKVLTSTSRYGSLRKKQDSFTMRVSGQTCKLYYR